MKNKDKIWENYKKNLTINFEATNYSSFLQKFVMLSSHKFLEAPYKKDTFFEKILVVGAGSGEHLNFIDCQFNSYTISDIDKRMISLAKSRFNSRKFSKNISFEIQSANSLTYNDSTFDRLIASHVLEHIYEPHKAVEEWIRVTKNGGILSVLIPADPGLAWSLGRCLGPRKHALSLGIPYDYLMAREHVNSCNNLIAILRHYFPESSESFWPTRIPSINMNLFFSFHAKVKK